MRRAPVRVADGCSPAIVSSCSFLCVVAEAYPMVTAYAIDCRDTSHSLGYMLIRLQRHLSFSWLYALCLYSREFPSLAEPALNTLRIKGRPQPPTCLQRIGDWPVSSSRNLPGSRRGAYRGMYERDVPVSKLII